MTARGKAGHQAVARAGAEPGADVEPGGDGVGEDARDQQAGARGEVVDGGGESEGGVGDQADHDHVADRAQAGTLPQRDPQEQDRHRDEVGDQADRDPGVPGDALVQHVPRAEAEAGPQHQREADPEEHQPAVEPGQVSA
ncbi:hypothetical protein GCM10027610_049130 [Dactylosporangium cerinum]